jgi:zinc D-Ala-D-Ala carboxypeptidase
MTMSRAETTWRNPLVRILAVLALTISLTTVASAIAPSAYADGCYTWSRTLRQGTSGGDVAQLQIRVAGWMSYGEVLAIDGVFGARTDAAVRRFQSGYGLTVDGIAGSQTFGKIYELQKDDCSPAHFAWSEVDDDCGSGYDGGSVSAAQVKENLKRAMWKAEALRHKLGDRPIIVSSGFRNLVCDGYPYGQHTYGKALDLVPTWDKSGLEEFCDIAKAARYAGYNGIFGPGYPGHYDHVHVDSRSTRYWDASDCGVLDT